MSFTIHEGHVLDVLQTLPAGLARTCVTSPPYWGLRDYGVPPQDWPEVRFSPMPGLPEMVIPAQSVAFGLEADPWAYVGHSVALFREVRRVLAEGSTLWLNLGDSYAATSKGSGGTSSTTIGNGRGQSTSAGTFYDPVKFDLMSHGLKPKDLVGIPWRVAFALQADGWFLRSDVIWSKRNPMPESVTDRPTKAHEYVFLLATGGRYFYDHEAIKEQSSNGSHGGGTASSERYMVGSGRNDGNRSMGILTESRNRRSVWTINTAPFPGAHFAVFPEALPEVCIKAGSAVGDTVLDPFNGSGTTGLVARKLGRSYVGCELNPVYAAMARERIAAAVPPTADEMADKGLTGQVGLFGAA